MIHIEWSSRAEEDFNTIFDYIAEENPAAAVRQTNLILESVQQLRRFAESGMRSIIRRNRKLVVPRTPYASTTGSSMSVSNLQRSVTEPSVLSNAYSPTSR